MNNEPLAAIDIGTNTFRLLIAEVHPDSGKNSYSIREIYSERIITRLGEGIHNNAILKKDSITRSITALKKFSEIISRSNVYKTSAIATSALREAKNSDTFIKKAKETTGLEIKIITGEEEAKITSSGMLMDIITPTAALMVDIGGGSTELIFTGKGKPLSVHSLNLGVVYLAGKYMKNDPPLNNDLNQMADEISQKITPAVTSFSKLFGNDTLFIGTAGTVSALAAITQHLIKFEHDKIHNFKLSIDNVRNIYSAISILPSKERAKHITFEPARLDIIVPGALILLELMRTFGFNEITVSNYGLREGILIDLYNKLNHEI